MHLPAFWDVFMDFSLLQPSARYRFLRDITALKSRWPYYLIMIVDPILRFNWVFYTIFAHDTQHSSIASFLIGFAEVTRRGMWTLLRVENEHCANVAQYKASRDVPLPYRLNDDDDSVGSLAATGGGIGGGGVGISSEEDPDMKSKKNKNKQRKQPEQQQQQDNNKNNDGLIRSPSAARVSWTGAVTGRTGSGHSTAVDVLQQPPTPGIGPSFTAPPDTAAVSAAEEGRTPGEESLGNASMRRRQRADTAGKRSITRLLAEAHKQDFEKKRKPDPSSRSVRGGEMDGMRDVEEDDDDDDDDDDDLDLIAASDNGTDDEMGSMMDERMEVQEAQMLSRKGKGNQSD